MHEHVIICHRGIEVPVEAGEDDLASVIDRLQRTLSDVVDMHVVLGVFLVMIDLARSDGTLSLVTLERVAGPLRDLRPHIQALQSSGLISIRTDGNRLNDENDVFTINDQQLLDVWRQVSVGR